MSKNELLVMVLVLALELAPVPPACGLSAAPIGADIRSTAIMPYPDGTHDYYAVAGGGVGQPVAVTAIWPE